MGREQQELLDKLWEIAVTLHQYLKKAVLDGEEFNNEFTTFLQPAMERQHALDHIIRAEAARLNINQQHDKQEYIRKQLEIAIGHLYRGFFDALDWFGIDIRRRIREDIKRYSHDCILAAIPNYYSELRPQIDRINQEIATLRDQKDIRKGSNELLEEVKKYRKELDKLLTISAEIGQKIPSLQEYRRKEEERERNKKSFQIVVGIALTIIGATLGYWLK